MKDEGLAASHQSPATSHQLPLRLHWTALAATLIAFVTLWISEGQSLALPLLIAGLLASQRASPRLANNSALLWMLRIAVFGIILALDAMRPDNLANTFFDFRFNWAGELLAAELVLQLWKQRPEGGGRGVVVILLSGLVFLIACDITEDTAHLPYIAICAPMYMLLLVLSIRHYRLPAPPETTLFGIGILEAPPLRAGKSNASAALQIVFGLALGIALALGTGMHYTFRYFRVGLTAWGMRFLNERMPSQRVGLSTTPRLGETDDLKGSPERVLRITGGDVPTHWRALAFSEYAQGAWEPSVATRERIEAPTAPIIKNGGSGDRSGATSSAHVVVTRLTGNLGLLCEPLASISFDPMDTESVTWGQVEGGPLQTGKHGLTSYGLDISSDELYQGPFCAPPSAGQRARLLAVPKEIEPGVRTLARSIAGNVADPRARADAIERYLILNHTYSLTYHLPQHADPVSEFLLHKGAAHCEYFASSATILLRCLKVPTRYVVGYYAHEGDSRGATIIRQRDAHAWAECWIDGLGWLTVDATPGNGRPDKLENEYPIPPWTRLREWFSDTWGRALDWLKGPQAVRAGVAVGIIAFLVLAWQWQRQRQRVRPAQTSEFAYAAPAQELARMAARFERLCHNVGLTCPPEFTWLEYVTGASGQAAAQAAGLDVEALAAFVRAYNASRFGPLPDASGLDSLDAQLSRLEQIRDKR